MSEKEKTSQLWTGTVKFGLVAVIALLSALLALQLAPPQSMQLSLDATSPSNNTSLGNSLSRTEGLTVSGSGTIYTAPNLAIIKLGVDNYGLTVQEAQKANSAAMSDIINTIKNLGVEEKNIQTSHYNVSAVSAGYGSNYHSRIVNLLQEGKNRSEIEYFSVDNTITIKTKDLDKVEKIINAAIEEGANAIDSVQFTLEDFGEVRNQAYIQAIKVAEERADQVASTLGVEKGPLLGVQGVQYDYQFGYGVNQSVSWEGGGGPGSSASISTGQVEVKVTINLHYALSAQ